MKHKQERNSFSFSHSLPNETLEKKFLNSSYSLYPILLRSCKGSDFMMKRFNNLPKEITQEILTRVPTESVLECKLVCKPWRDVVRLPSFPQLHLTHLNSADGDSGKLGFLILSQEKSHPKFYYAEYDEHFHDSRLYSREIMMDFNPSLEYCSFVGSCNGLLCFNSWMVDENGQIHTGPTYVCNLITREYIILPDFQRKLSSWAGFGYSSSTNEYKFVSIDVSREDSTVRVVQVYTLGSGWRTVGKMDKNVKNVMQCMGAFADGALHWVDQAGTVLAFSLTDEKFIEIPSPPPYLAQADVPYFALLQKVLGGFLGAICFFDTDRIEIWFLKKNKDNYDLSWSKEFSFSSLISSPFGYTKSGMLLCYGSKQISSYDSNDSSAKMDVSFGKSISQAIPHTNTLVSLKVLGEKNAKIMEFGERLRSRE